MIDFFKNTADKHMDYESAMVTEAQKIFNENYAERYPSLGTMLQSTEKKEARVAATSIQLIRNQEQFMENMKRSYGEATTVAALGDLAPRMVDIIRVAMPNTIGHVIADIQPMQTLTGQVLVVRPKFGNTAAGVTAGDEVFKTQTDGTYALNSYTEVVGAGDGGDTTFSKTLGYKPIKGGTVVVKHDGVAIGQDDGSNVVTGTNLTGTIDYVTGVLDLTYTVAPALGVAITAVYQANLETSEDNYLRN